MPEQDRSMSTAAESLFAAITSAKLAEFVRDGREEDLYLEFKEKEDRRDGSLRDGDRYAFSKAVSGFANADGGVLVWGVETKHSGDHPDRACGLKPLANAAGFRAKLLDSVLNTTQPPVDGVRIEVVPGEGAGDYVKCLIPASDRPPHRAMLADREYWCRASNGFRKMEHYELADAFGRRHRPVLRLAVDLRPRPDPDKCEDVHFSFLNEGRGLARHAGFTCIFGAGTIINGVHGLQNLSGLNARPIVSYYDAINVVHATKIFASLGRAIIMRDNKGTPLPIDVTWYCEHMEAKSQTIEIEPNQPTLLCGTA
jgi:hypothetical protein